MSTPEFEDEKGTGVGVEFGLIDVVDYVSDGLDRPVPDPILSTTLLLDSLQATGQ